MQQRAKNVLEVINDRMANRDELTKSLTYDFLKDVYGALKDSMTKENFVYVLQYDINPFEKEYENYIPVICKADEMLKVRALEARQSKIPEEIRKVHKIMIGMNDMICSHVPDVEVTDKYLKLDRPYKLTCGCGSKMTYVTSEDGGMYVCPKCGAKVDTYEGTTVPIKNY